MCIRDSVNFSTIVLALRLYRKCDILKNLNQVENYGLYVESIDCIS